MLPCRAKFLTLDNSSTLDCARLIGTFNQNGPWPMQLVVPIAVMTDAMMLAIIWRMAFHVSLLFFMVQFVF